MDIKGALPKKANRMDDALVRIKQRFRRISSFSLPPPAPWPVIQQQQQQQTDVEIRTLGDLIALADTWGMREAECNNVDLLALTRIRGELEQLHALIGLSAFKKAVLDQVLYFLQHLHGGGPDADFLHTVLCGPPGTGKTEIAKILGALYANLGVLKSGVFKKVTRSDLVGGYLGQTAIKTSKVVQECLGGCLFIDEAYSLGNDSYSKECLDTLCEALSDRKAELMVIIAGYEKDLDETVFEVNRGLASRFIWRFVLDDYRAQELHAMFLKKVRDNHWTTAVSEVSVAWFEKRSFPYYGRDIELLFTYTKCCHGRRIFGRATELRKCLLLRDVEAGYEMLEKNRQRQKASYEIPGFYV